MLFIKFVILHKLSKLPNGHGKEEPSNRRRVWWTRTSGPLAPRTKDLTAHEALAALLHNDSASKERHEVMAERESKGLQKPFFKSNYLVPHAGLAQNGQHSAILWKNPKVIEEGVSQMFVDYLAVMLLNLGAGLALLAHYLYVNPGKEYRRSWAAGFFAVGFLGLVTSLPMLIMWPLPGGFNVAYAGPMLFLSMVFLAAGLTLMLEWEPLIPAIYGLFGGIYAIIIGFRLLDLKMGAAPGVAFAGFVLTGLGGILVLPAIYWHKNRTLTIITALVLGVAAVIWLFTGYEAVWAHILDFAHYLPPTMLHSAK